MVKYPKVKVQLVGENGNAFEILGKVTGEMRRAGIKKEAIEQYKKEAMSGNYDNLLAKTMEYVEVT